ncbi:MAG: hypothetical protein AB1750_02750, partial [Chloroflexota bacterium]
RAKRSNPLFGRGDCFPKARNDGTRDFIMLKTLLSRLFTRENMLALALALIIAALVVFTADVTPTWIYQGF